MTRRQFENLGQFRKYERVHSLISPDGQTILVLTGKKSYHAFERTSADERMVGENCSANRFQHFYHAYDDLDDPK